ncbi:YceI family protein [Aureibaculum sp. 2210JD6-5]|uniref:YceI family protein n=1 Tax=Aureibaculum sp. 2210JD6-5 TaxID=3103957 RepID=UPI002AAD3C41|nr:YceI family protein [Aureibaculum sp. 2210JD6-5]MDY7395770.1 YceI family protein [Aureibaculum sp. 2210JD6-5]
MRIVINILFFLSLCSVSAQEQSLGPPAIEFKIKNMGFYVDGTFNKVNISTNFDADNLDNSYIKGVIQVSSIDTDNKKRDKHLRTADYFDVEKFSTIKLTSTKIEKKSGNKYQLTAKLTIKKTTKTIVIPLEVRETKSLILFKSNFSINRLDYGVGESSWVMSDTVKIEVNFVDKK